MSRSARSRYLTAALLCLLAAPRAMAQTATLPLDRLASELVPLIPTEKNREGLPPRVVIAGFPEATGRISELWHEMPDQLEPAIRKQSPAFVLAAQATVEQLWESRKYKPEDFRNERFAIFLGEQFKADYVITGSAEPLEGFLDITARVLRVSDGRQMGQVIAHLNRTPEIDRILAMPAGQTLMLKPASGIYEPGRHGVTSPQCEYCPHPNYTREGVQKKIQGTVNLEVMVTAEGTVSSVRVLRGLEQSLDDRAVETVLGWRFKPALRPDGQAVTTRCTVEVTYKVR